MLFGYLKEQKTQCAYTDDVQCRRAEKAYFVFQRPLVLASELHVAGAMAFASSHGFAGLDLVEWALLQGLESVAGRREAAPQSQKS